MGFHLTFNYAARNAKIEFKKKFSKERVEIFKSKIKQEMQDAIDKEIFINPQDAELIQGFLNKIKTDLEKNTK